MSLATALLLFVCAVVAVGIVTTYLRFQQGRRIRRLLDMEEARLIQEQIDKLESESTRKSQVYKDAKEKYDEKWRNRVNRNSKPSKPDSSDG